MREGQNQGERREKREEKITKKEEGGEKRTGRRDKREEKVQREKAQREKTAAKSQLYNNSTKKIQ